MASPVLSTYMICGPLPIVSSLGVFVPPKDPAKDGAVSPEHYISQDSKAWHSHSSISYTFLDGKPLNWQLELVQRAIAEYTRYANVNVVRTLNDKDESADIRISLNRDGGAWSAIGTDALKIAKGAATMNLGFLSVDSDDSGPRTAQDRELIYNLILHQLGHAFGLAHEWQIDWAQVKHNHKNEILEQHIALFQETGASGTSNFQDPDEKSIMRFFIPDDYLAQGTTKVTSPNGLSDMDKAWLTLIYPGKAAVGADEETGILHALNVLDIPLDVSSRVLLSSTVSEMRFHYQEHISGLWGDVLSAKAVKDTVRALQEEVKQNSSVLGGLKLEFDVMKGKITGTAPLVDHNYEEDLYDSVAAAVLDPQFAAILASSINQDEDVQPDAQNFVNFNPLQNYMSGINPQASPDVQRFLGPLLTSLVPVVVPMLGQLIFSALPPDAMSGSGIYSHGLPPNVEQGIFGTLTKFLKHPTFLTIVRDIASDMIDRNDQS